MKVTITQIDTDSISYNDAAMKFHVSIATIRNWLKEGYLHSKKAGFVSQESVECFSRNISGKGKLTSRANKLHKDSHNHEELCGKIDEIIHCQDFSDDISFHYESYLSESFRNKEGIYYTPEHIVESMMDGIESVEGFSFLEPCCGGGNFIIKALDKGFKPENIYGFDTDENAVKITKKRIFDKTGFDSPNIICGDFLELCQKTKRRFDYIFTNPPWGKKLSKEKRIYYSNIYRSGNSLDTCSLFFFACHTLLINGGRLGFLMPESFFNISTFEDARKMALSNTIERIIDYGKTFKGLITKAQAIIIKNELPKNDTIVDCSYGDKRHTRFQTNFNSVPKHILNFRTDEEAFNIIERLYSIPHITLKNNAQWGLGIITGNNALICSKVKRKGDIPIYRGKDITPKGLKTASLFISEDLSRCQQVAPLELYKAKEKLVYRFISSNLVFYCDKEQRLILNSANMLILNDDFPITGKQLSDLLNSDIMNWLFKSIFNTHKVLRSDLELMPLHIEYFKNNPTFDETSFLKFLNIEKHNGTYSIKR